MVECCGCMLRRLGCFFDFPLRIEDVLFVGRHGLFLMFSPAFFESIGKNLINPLGHDVTLERRRL